MKLWNMSRRALLLISGLGALLVAVVPPCSGQTPAITVAPVINTIAGNGTNGAGDGGSATGAQLVGPFGVAVDVAGNVYIADRDDDLRKINANTGIIISTIAGTATGGISGGGGQATEAQLSGPDAVTVDRAGNIYIVELGNNRICKINSSNGYISTITGTGTACFSGDSALATTAELKYPYGVAVDGAGNIYIADSGNNRIRGISASNGCISTIAGTATFGLSRDGSPALSFKVFLDRVWPSDQRGLL